MRNKTKRFLVRYPVLLVLLLIGSVAIELIAYTFIINTYASMGWVKQNLNVSINMANLAADLPLWTLILSVWLIIVNLAMFWYIARGLEARLKRKWPDPVLDNNKSRCGRGELISLRRTERRAYKRRNA